MRVDSHLIFFLVVVAIACASAGMWLLSALTMGWIILAVLGMGQDD